MVVYSDELGYTTGVATTFTAITGSPYSPLKDGRLLQVRLAVAAGAATALMEIVVVKISSVSFGGVELFVAIAGGGIRTAPAVPIPLGIQDCDLPVHTGVKLTIEYKHISATTPVTPEIEVIGVFEG